MNETFKAIPGYEGIYYISPTAVIKSVKYRSRHGNRVLKVRIGNHGYPVVDLWKDGKPKKFTVHRLMAITYLGDKPLQVNHINHIKTDNRLINLEYVAARENTNHWKTRKRPDGCPTGVRKTRSNSYAASIHIKGKRLHLGTFKTMEKAAETYRLAAQERGEGRYLRN